MPHSEIYSRFFSSCSSAPFGARVSVSHAIIRSRKIICHAKKLHKINNQIFERTGLPSAWKCVNKTYENDQMNNSTGNFRWKTIQEKTNRGFEMYMHRTREKVARGKWRRNVNNKTIRKATWKISLTTHKNGRRTGVYTKTTWVI